MYWKEYGINWNWYTPLDGSEPFRRHRSWDNASHEAKVVGVIEKYDNVSTIKWK